MPADGPLHALVQPIGHADQTGPRPGSAWTGGRGAAAGSLFMDFGRASRGATTPQLGIDLAQGWALRADLRCARKAGLVVGPATRRRCNMSSSPADTAGHSPIDDFSQCHAGILGHLQTLGSLPALLEPAARARQVAADAVGFFREAVFEHHSEEERELFPAVLASAAAGEEHERVKSIVDALTAEHRKVEAAWSKLEPKLKAVAKGHDTDVDPADIRALVEVYQAHARYEEEVFLPLSQAILGRNSNHLAALGMSLHMRHALPQVLQRFAGRI
jgi:hypothetical protein